MELNKSILLLLIFSPILSFFAQAMCVPRNISDSEATDSAFDLGSAVSFSSSAPIHAPTLPPAASPSPPPVSPTQLPSILPSPSNNAAMMKICGLTDYPAECIATIAPSLTGKTDSISVLKMGMQALHKSFEEAIAVAMKLTKDPSASAVVKDSLDTCLESFDSGMSDLNDALIAISSHDIGTLSTMLSATITYPDTCEEAFAEQPGLDSPMKEMDQKLTELASINLAIAASLHWS